MFSHKSDEWETPQDLFNSLNKEFNFTLDVCASPFNKKCNKYFDIEVDGLKQDWTGNNIWCNPPYSNIPAFMKKCSESKELCVVLVPARTDTRWFHDYCYQKPNVEIRFIKGRLKFNNSKNSAPFPSMIVIFKKGVKNEIFKKKTE